MFGSGTMTGTAKQSMGTMARTSQIADDNQEVKHAITSYGLARKRAHYDSRPGNEKMKWPGNELNPTASRLCGSMVLFENVEMANAQQRRQRVALLLRPRQ
jgi:hypothetical protein